MRTALTFRMGLVPVQNLFPGLCIDTTITLWMVVSNGQRDSYGDVPATRSILVALGN